MIVLEDQKITAIKERIDSFPVWRCNKDIQLPEAYIEENTLLHLSYDHKKDKNISVYVRDSKGNNACVEVEPENFDKFFEEAQDLKGQIDIATKLLNKENTLEFLTEFFQNAASMTTCVTLVLFIVFSIFFVVDKSLAHGIYVTVSLGIMVVCWILRFVFDRWETRLFKRRFKSEVGRLM